MNVCDIVCFSGTNARRFYISFPSHSHARLEVKADVLRVWVCVCWLAQALMGWQNKIYILFTISGRLNPVYYTLRSMRREEKGSNFYIMKLTLHQLRPVIASVWRETGRLDFATECVCGCISSHRTKLNWDLCTHYRASTYFQTWNDRAFPS